MAERHNAPLGSACPSKSWIHVHAEDGWRSPHKTGAGACLLQGNRWHCRSSLSAALGDKNSLQTQEAKAGHLKSGSCSKASSVHRAKLKLRPELPKRLQRAATLLTHTARALQGEVQLRGPGRLRVHTAHCTRHVDKAMLLALPSIRKTTGVHWQSRSSASCRSLIYSLRGPPKKELSLNSCALQRLLITGYVSASPSENVLSTCQQLETSSITLNILAGRPQQRQSLNH